MLFLTAAVMTLLAACGATNSNVVMPRLEQYAPAVQARAADEFDALAASCPRTETTPDCSALRTFINDYKTLRDRVRAAE